MEPEIETEYNTTDMIHYAIDQKPIDFENTFKSLINDKLVAAIDAKKMEIASRLYSNDESESDDESEEYIETEEETSEDQENGETA
jgi:hypothetical protein